MAELTINIPDHKLPFFMLLAKELDFLVIEEKKTVKKLTSKQVKRAKELKDALNEVNEHLQGKIKLKTAEQLLNEL